MRVNAEKIVVECNYHEDVDKQCWKVCMFQHIIRSCVRTPERQKKTS